MVISAYPPLVDPRVTEAGDALIYKLNIGVRHAGEATGPERCLMLGADRLAITNSADLATAMARGRIGEGPPLREDKAFRDLAGQAGEGPGILLFAPGRPVLRAGLQAAGVGEAADDLVDHYAAPVLLSGSWAEAGLRLRGFMPYPSAPSAAGAEQP
jgi:hypothetical protein